MVLIYGYRGRSGSVPYRPGKNRYAGKAEIVINANGKDQIVVTEVPYMVNKAMMIEKTAALINEKRIEGISAYAMNPTVMDTVWYMT